MMISFDGVIVISVQKRRSKIVSRARRAATSVDHLRRAEVLKIACAIHGNRCMSQRNIMRLESYWKMYTYFIMKHCLFELTVRFGGVIVISVQKRDQILSEIKSSLRAVKGYKTYGRLRLRRNYRLHLLRKRRSTWMSEHMDVRVTPMDPLLTTHKSYNIWEVFFSIPLHMENTEQRGTRIENGS